MLPTSPSTLREFIVLQLAESPGSNARKLHNSLLENYGRCTDRAVFKELRLLQEQGVVIKGGEGYSIRLGWASELYGFAERVFHNYLHSDAFLRLIQGKKKNHTWRFNDLRRLDDFLMQSSLAFFRESNPRSICHYTRHTWFYLVHPEKELQFEQALRRSNKKLYMVIGNNTCLDRLCSREFPSDVYHYSYAESPFHALGLESLSIIAEYIITVRMERKLSESLDATYQSVSRSNQLTPAIIRTLSQSRGRSALRWEHNEAKAKRLKKQFANYFGLSEEQI